LEIIGEQLIIRWEPTIDELRQRFLA